MSRAARFLVSGRVQGVFFRASARQQAEMLGLRGLARNLDDGRVEVIVQGDDAAIEALARWLQHGPPMARVERIERSAWHDQVPAGFAVV
jgi:acylphosphatase